MILFSYEPDYYCYQYTVVTMEEKQYYLNEECYPCSFERNYIDKDMVHFKTERYDKTFTVLNFTDNSHTYLACEIGIPEELYAIREDVIGGRYILTIIPVRFNYLQDIAGYGLVVSREHIKGLCFND